MNADPNYPIPLIFCRKQNNRKALQSVKSLFQNFDFFLFNSQHKKQLPNFKFQSNHVQLIFQIIVSPILKIALTYQKQANQKNFTFEFQIHNYHNFNKVILKKHSNFPIPEKTTFLLAFVWYYFPTKLSFMNTSIAHTKYIPTKNSIRVMNVQPLWKKVHLRFQQNDDATSVSSHNAHEKDFQFNQKDSSFSQFLTKMHNRISQSASGGDSEIVDKLSINWDQCEGENKQISRLKDTSLSFEAFSQGQINDELVFELKLLKKCQRMQQFLVILSKINPQICSQVLNERKQKEQIVKQCNELLDNQKRSEKHTKILMSQVNALENKNFNLIKDFEKLKKQVDEQIILEEDRCKYKYEKELQKTKKEMQKKLNLLTSKFQLSTKYSISIQNSADEMQENCILLRDTNNSINSQARRVQSAERIKQKKILPLQRTRNKAKGITDYEGIADQIVRPSTKSLHISQFKQ